MEETQNPYVGSVGPEVASSTSGGRHSRNGNGNRGYGFPGMERRGHGHGHRSWIKIDHDGNSTVVELDKSAIMRHCSLPARDLRLLDPLFIYPSTILGREKTIVVSLEQIRCIITADEVFLMNSLDGCVLQYKMEFCKRLQTTKDQASNNIFEDLPFEFRALELVLELTCTSLDAQARDLEMEICPVLDELALSINTLNLERVRRLKGYLLALTQRVQKVHDEIEHLMDDDGDMAEMYLTEKKKRSEAYELNDIDEHSSSLDESKEVSKSAPVSPVRTISGVRQLQRAFSSIVASNKHSMTCSSGNGENIDQLEMLLEAYFVFIGNTLNKLLSLKEYIDDTEDLINIKLTNIQNHLIKFELLLTAATFVAAIFAVVTGIFGMNFVSSVFDLPKNFNWVLIIAGCACMVLYTGILVYLRHKKVFPL